MGYNSKCFVQNCTLQCCGIGGNCTFSKVDCFYYYSDTEQTAPIFGIILGSVLGILLIVSILIYCYRKRSK